jgi:hypothetical protein
MIKHLLLLLVTLTVAGCATGTDYNRQRLATLPQHYRQFDVVMAWEMKDIPSGTVIDGVVQNVRYAYMNDLEVSVFPLDPQGKAMSRAVAFVIPNQIPRDGTAPFTIKLSKRLPPGSPLRFTYKYRYDEGGERGGGGDWMQSFDAVVPDY